MPPVYFLYSTLKKHFKSSVSGKSLIAPALPDYPGSNGSWTIPEEMSVPEGKPVSVVSGTLPLVKNKPKNPLPPLHVTTSCGKLGLDTIPEVIGEKQFCNMHIICC